MLAGFSTAQTADYRTLQLSDGNFLGYLLLLPTDFDETQSYPVLLALPPGPQDQQMVQAGLFYWQQGPARGWVVVSPAAPEGQLFFQGAERYLPELLDEISRTVKVEGDKVHLAGVSNGGLSAFRVALDHPERFASLVTLPGFPPTQADFDSLDRLRDLPISLFVGERDSNWRSQVQTTEMRLKELGARVSLTVMAGQGHVIQTLSSDQLFDLFDSYR